MHDWNQVASERFAVISVMRKVTAHVPVLRECGNRKDCQTRMPESAHDPSAHFPRFIRNCRATVHELRKVKGTSKSIILVPLSI
jgi:hypothetical protein